MNDDDATDSEPTPSFRDWDPSDPDAVIVQYDLSGWTFDQQAELASMLAEAEIPHTWDDTDLLVPEDAESLTDVVVEEVELRLGIVDLPAGPVALPDPIALDADAEKTEYELSEWDDEQRSILSANLAAGEFPFAWEAATLVVHSDDEVEIESLLDSVESGEIGMPNDVSSDAERLPFETLTTFFLVGERLRKNPLHTDGLNELTRALDLADPKRPPYGVDSRLWVRTCEMAEELVDALVEGDEPDVEEAQAIAGDLHDLLRPFV